MRRRAPVSNYPNPNKLIIQFICQHTIDRIQLSIRNRSGCYKYVKHLFTDRFGKPKVTRPDGKGGKVVNSFDYAGKMIQLVNYNGQLDFWFSVTIHDSDDDNQSLIRDMFHFMFAGETSDMVYVKEIEFAWDLYPDSIEHLWLLRNAIKNSICLKNSRVDALNEFKGTCYQGKNGHAHNGCKGLRIYTKEIDHESFVRVELQLNQESAKKLKINLDSFPIRPSKVDFFDFFEFRQGHDEQGQINVVNDLLEMMEKKKSIKLKPIDKFSMQGKIRARALLREMHKSVHDDTIPVIAQISSFKKIKDKYGLTCALGRFFPIDDVIQFRSPRYNRGSLRVPQWTNL